MIEIILGGNHQRILINYDGYFICQEGITKEEVQVIGKWNVNNIGYNILTSQVDEYGFTPYWVFYFHEEHDAMAFKLRWA